MAPPEAPALNRWLSLLLACVPALAGCGADPGRLPVNRCFPGVWRIGRVTPDCDWCGPAPLPMTSECPAADCEYMEILVLLDGGAADRREIQVSRMLGHFSSLRPYPTARTWEVRGDELVLDAGDVTEEPYQVLGCYASSVTVDAPWVTRVTRYWTRLEDELARPALAAAGSGVWTDVSVGP